MPEKERAYDLDFVCSIPNVLCIIAEENDLGDALRVTKMLANNSKVWQQFLSELYDTSLEEAKRMPHKCIFGGKPLDGNPLLWTLKAEIHNFSRERSTTTTL